MKNYLRILWSTLVNFVHSVAFFPQLQLQWKNGQQGAKRVGGEAVAFFPQLQLQWKNGQQGAKRVGGEAVAFFPQLYRRTPIQLKLGNSRMAPTGHLLCKCG
jgi:hypothetical protein